MHWLLRQWVNGGDHVLWLAHRDELLRQAALAFYELAGLAASRDRLRIRLVSGQFCGFHQIDAADDIILCSVISLSRSLASAGALLQNPRLFVVTDEAHHAPARSYRDAIDVLSQARSQHLLGLTATPTRTAEHERPELARLFGDQVIYQVSPSGLIARELLASETVDRWPVGSGFARSLGDQHPVRLEQEMAVRWRHIVSAGGDGTVGWSEVWLPL